MRDVREKIFPEEASIDPAIMVVLVSCNSAVFPLQVKTIPKLSGMCKSQLTKSDSGQRYSWLLTFIQPKRAWLGHLLTLVLTPSSTPKD